MRACSLLLALALLPAPAAAQTYRWTDDQGRTHYTQVPPGDGRPYTTLGGAPPPASAPNQDALNRSLEDGRRPAAATDVDAEKAAEAAARREAQCEQVREQLAYLETTPAIRMRKNDAQQSRVTEDEHAQKRAELRKHLAEQCS